MDLPLLQSPWSHCSNSRDITGMLRANSRLRQTLGDAGVTFLNHAAGAIGRILPHVQVSSWVESPWAAPASVWASSNLTEIRVTLAIGLRDNPTSRSLT